MIKLFQDELPINVNLPFFAQKKYLASKSENYGWFVSDNFILSNQLKLMTYLVP